MEATIRRVKNVRLKDVQKQRVTHSCLAGERILAFSSAVAFRTARPPALSALGSVRAASRRAGDRIIVTVRSSIERPESVRVELQIHAICVRAPS